VGAVHASVYRGVVTKYWEKKERLLAHGLPQACIVLASPLNKIILVVPLERSGSAGSVVRIGGLRQALAVSGHCKNNSG
jgi:hypothetical protein